MVIDQTTASREGGEEQSLLIRDWQPIPSSYSQTHSSGILMSCALYAFVNAKLHAANTITLQRYKNTQRELGRWPCLVLIRCKPGHNERSAGYSGVKWPPPPPAQIFIFVAFGAGWPPDCLHKVITFTFLGCHLHVDKLSEVSSSNIFFAFSHFIPPLSPFFVPFPLYFDGYMNVLMAVPQ